MNLFDKQFEVLPVIDADISIHRGVTFSKSYKDIIAEIINNTPWRAEKIKIWGKEVLQPRLVAWYGDAGVDYTYSGIRFTPEKWTSTLLEIRSRVKQLSGAQFNSVLLNYYRDENDSMGFHSDDEPELGYRPVIASLSLGEERKFQLRHRHRKSLKMVQLNLQEGDLLIMKGFTQKNWQHGIPKERHACGARVNLTFRQTALPV